jgi:hypothetical protein
MYTYHQRLSPTIIHNSLPTINTNTATPQEVEVISLILLE